MPPTQVVFYNFTEARFHGRRDSLHLPKHLLNQEIAGASTTERGKSTTSEQGEAMYREKLTVH